MWQSFAYIGKCLPMLCCTFACWLQSRRDPVSSMWAYCAEKRQRRPHRRGDGPFGPTIACMRRRSTIKVLQDPWELHHEFKECCCCLVSLVHLLHSPHRLS